MSHYYSDGDEISTWDEKIYYAVLNSLSYNKDSLQWVVDRASGRTVVFLLVDTKRGMYLTSESQPKAEKDTNKILGEYITRCKEMKIKTESLVIEEDDVAKGLLSLISEKKITKLVIDAAAEDWYSQSCWKQLSSPIAVSVKDQVDSSCDVWFICHGNLVYWRKSATEQDRPELHESDGKMFSSISSDQQDQPQLYEDDGKKSASKTASKHVRKAADEEDEAQVRGNDGRMYFAVLHSLRFSKDNLQWVIDRAAGRIIVFLYVDTSKGAYLTGEGQPQNDEDTHRVLDEYMNFCKQKKIMADRLMIKKDDIADGLLELTIRGRITELIMPAGEDFYSKRCLKHFSSPIAKTLNLQALRSLKIWFICHGNLIHTRDAIDVRSYKVPNNPGAYELGIPTISFEDLRDVTWNFTEHTLGVGGFGMVYRATLWGEVVAIKVLSSKDDETKQETFEKEVSILGQLKHQNLVPLIAACVDQKQYALVYAYMPGKTLEARLAKADFTWQERLRMATELCNALVFLHSQSPDVIVHSDIKPENVLLDESNRVRLGDFGISRRVNLSPTNTHKSTYNIVGTDDYLDPNFKSTGEVSPKIDIYAFGMVLLRLIVKSQYKPGFQLSSDVEKALQEDSLNEVVNLEANWPDELSKKLAKLAVSCCDIRDVKKRPHTAEIYKDLKQMMKEWCNESS